MSETQKLDRAPIREAIIDIRFSSKATIEDIKSFADSISDLFTSIEPVIVNDVTFNHSTNAQSSEVTHDQVLTGYVLQSESHIYQVKLDGIVASKLEPYDCWDSFMSDARDFWIKYSSSIEIQKINRIALRYVNCIEIPLNEGKANLSDYLEAAPELPDNLNVSINAFVSKVQFFMPEYDCQAILIHASEGHSKPLDRINIIVDIDVFKEHSETASSRNGGDIWPLFHALRDAKNQIFFSAITEQTKGLLK